jgi:hypothetical protein
LGVTVGGHAEVGVDITDEDRFMDGVDTGGGDDKPWASSFNCSSSSNARNRLVHSIPSITGIGQKK